MTVKEHLSKLHTGLAEHLVKRAQHHAGMSEHYGKLADVMSKSNTDGDAATSYRGIASLHKDMSEQCQDCAQEHLASARELNQAQKAMGGDDAIDLHRMVPLPAGLSFVPRSGAPAARTAKLAGEFEKLFTVDGSDIDGL